jgi:hypothetical protein
MPSADFFVNHETLKATAKLFPAVLPRENIPWSSKFTQDLFFLSFPCKAPNPIEQKAISHSLCPHWKSIPWKSGKRSCINNPSTKLLFRRMRVEHRIHFFARARRADNNCWILCKLKQTRCSTNRLHYLCAPFLLIPSASEPCAAELPSETIVFRRANFHLSETGAYVRFFRARTAGCKLSARLIDCVDCALDERMLCGFAKCITVTAASASLFFIVSAEGRERVWHYSRRRQSCETTCERVEFPRGEMCFIATEIEHFTNSAPSEDIDFFWRKFFLWAQLRSKRLYWIKLPT